LNKRYTLYRFPSIGGSPKDFKFKTIAFIFALFGSFFKPKVYELKDNKTGMYRAYWM